MTERSKGHLRLAVLLLAGIVVQTSVGSDLRVDGVAPDLMLLLAICAGLFGGSRQGVLVGFASGLLSDLWMTDTPLGLAALTFCLVGYGVGALRSAVLPEGWVTIPVLVFLASVVGVVGAGGRGADGSDPDRGHRGGGQRCALPAGGVALRSGRPGDRGSDPARSRPDRRRHPVSQRTGISPPMDRTRRGLPDGVW
jgi:rod shape-determining protein MreD